MPGGKTFFPNNGEIGVAAVQVSNVSGELINVRCSICGKEYRVAPNAAIPICHDEFMQKT